MKVKADANVDSGVGRGEGFDWKGLKRRILARLDVEREFEALGVKFTGSRRTSGWREAKAYGREDHKPSAAVHVPSGVYYCGVAPVETLDLFDFAVAYAGGGVGETWKDVVTYYAGKAGVAADFGRRASGKGYLEETYQYKDIFGVVRYEVQRWRDETGRKTFRQRKPDGKGGFVASLAGIDPLPYRLPEVASLKSGETLWVVEGEKDADRLASEGLTATCNHMGASGTKHWDKFSACVHGLNVIVVPDNDRPGRAHATGIATRILSAAESVKVIALTDPEVGEKGDVSDWLDAGGTVERLREIADATEPWSISLVADMAADSVLPINEDRVDQPRIVNLEDVQPETIEWLLPGRIPLGKLSLIAGDPGLGKSTLTGDLIARLSVGGEIPAGQGDCFAKGASLILSSEEGYADTIRPRLDRAGADPTRVRLLKGIEGADGRVRAMQLGRIDILEAAVDSIPDLKLVLIDTVTSYLGDVDDHRSGPLRQVLEPLADLAERKRVAVVLVAHLNKTGGVRALQRITGSLAYVALARTVWMLVRDDAFPDRRLLLPVKNNLSPDRTGLAFRIVPGGKVAWEPDPVCKTADEALREQRRFDEGDGENSKTDAAEAWLLEKLGGGMKVSSKDLFAAAKAAGFGKNQLYKAKESLGVEATKSEFGGGGGWLWSLPSGKGESEEDPDW